MSSIPLLSASRRLASAGALATVLAVVGACNASSASSFDDGADPAPSGGVVATPPPEDQESGTTPFDAGPAPKAEYKWNPLCHVRDTERSCVPDDDGKDIEHGHPCGAEQGCRLSRADSDLVPTCRAASEKGVDGTACMTGTDCAKGFDCVEGLKGNVCRRYCCTGGCPSASSQNGGDSFCDVQKLVDSAAKAPLCIPFKKCTLLRAGECGESETCATLEDGRTGCVSKGDAGVGKSCDDVHCAADLTCLGQPGSRKCYQLCKVGSASTCPMNQMCKTTAAFSDTAFGVCSMP